MKPLKLLGITQRFSGISSELSYTKITCQRNLTSIQAGSLKEQSRLYLAILAKQAVTCCSF